MRPPLSFGGWIWRYDLEATGPSRTTVTLTYDWSGVPPQVREYLQFPPFGPDHLDNSLQHLSDLVAQVWRPRSAVAPVSVGDDERVR